MPFGFLKRKKGKEQQQAENPKKLDRSDSGNDSDKSSNEENKNLGVNGQLQAHIADQNQQAGNQQGGLNREEKMARIRELGAKAKAAGGRADAAKERGDKLEQKEQELAAKMRVLEQDVIDSRKRGAAFLSGDKQQQEWATREQDKVLKSLNQTSVPVVGGM